MHLETSVLQPPTASRSELVLKQVSYDLSQSLKQSQDPRKKIKLIATKTGIHARTLDRIINLENKPTLTTVFKIYKYLTKGRSQSDVINSSPEVIKDYLKEGLKQTLESDLFSQLDHSYELQHNPVFGEIYVLCCSGFITDAEISHQFGAYGLQLANEMVIKKILRSPRPGIYEMGEQHIDLTPECLLALGLLTAKNYAKPQNGHVLGKHMMSFLAEGVSEEAYKQLIHIDSEAYKQKLAILKDASNLGSKKFFTFSITDTLIPKEQE